MSVVRLVVLGLVALAGCFVATPMPTKVPHIERPTLAPDAFLEIESGVDTERRTYHEKADVCPKGSSSGCIEVETTKRKKVRVATATAVVNGTPISIGAVATVASPIFVADTDRARRVTSSCRRGRYTMILGALSMVAAGYMLNAGWGTEETERNQGLYVGGLAAGGAGLAALVLGRFAFGGQHCSEANELFDKWGLVYRDPAATTVKRDAAKLLEKLVEKYNHDHGAKPALVEPAPEAIEE